MNAVKFPFGTKERPSDVKEMSLESGENACSTAGETTRHSGFPERHSGRTTRHVGFPNRHFAFRHLNSGNSRWPPSSAFRPPLSPVGQSSEEGLAPHPPGPLRTAQAKIIGHASGQARRFCIHLSPRMNQDTFDIRAEQHTPASTERDFENALRPLQFDDFSGQQKVVDNLRIFV